MSYKIYLANEKNEGFNIPVLPSEIKFKQKIANDEFNVINLGEVTSINRSNVFEIEFESFFPMNSAGYVENDPLTPTQYKDKIMNWLNECKPVRFICKAGVVINELVSIENFEYEERAGEVGDIYYTIKLKKYQNFSSKKVTVKVEQEKPKPPTNSNSNSSRANSEQSGRFYTVVKGDCLWNIAKRFYGNGALWNKIYDANTNQIVNPNLIYPGQKLRIP